MAAVPARALCWDGDESTGIVGFLASWGVGGKVISMSINRRRHRLFVTRHTEYHLRQDECVGVRDRETGAWLRDHAALRLRAIRLPPNGHDHHWLGRRIQFWGKRTDVVTSPVVAVGRPPKESLDGYVSLATAGAVRC